MGKGHRLVHADSPFADMEERIWYLKRCRLFERLTPEEAQRLEARAVLRSFLRGQIIYFPSEPGESVLLLAGGRVKLKHVTADGKEAILAFIDEGELFGEMALFDNAPRNEFAEAAAASRVLAIPREDLLWLIERRPDFALHVTKLVGLRRRRLENRLRNVLFCSSRDRVIAILLELLDSHGWQRSDHWEISLPLSHQELAGLIGATRETVTVALGQLQLERLIQVRRRRITVLDRSRLAAALNCPDGLSVVPAVGSSGSNKLSP
jgi:CRP-like cAMP-binding protein